MSAYYNEIEPFAAQWLRNLIAAGHIAPGEVDERSITEVQADDIKGFTQCHFFAGIGLWSLALRWAGWDDARPVWTGSCPCQPFSAAGKRKGTADERHLWPDFHRLISECRPAIVFGEQVASKDGRSWFAGVRADLEAVGYAVGGADLCAAGIGAPHIRQRLWWVAHAAAEGRQGSAGGRIQPGIVAEDGGSSRVAHAECRGYQRQPEQRCPRILETLDGTEEPREPTGAHGASVCSRVGDTDDTRPQGRGVLPECPDQLPARSPSVADWSNAIWLPCADGKARRIEPGLAPLVDGYPGRVGLLRAYGNAISPQVAQEFIEAVTECLP